MALIKNPTQCEKILAVLEEHRGMWVNGQHFVRALFLTQAHARIWELRHLRSKYSYEGTIESSTFKDAHGFVSYRLID